MKKTLKFLTILSVILVAIFNVFLFLNIHFAFKFNVDFRDDIEEASLKTQVDASVICAVANVESRFKKDAKSEAGAIGIMQILPKTASFVCHLYGLEFEEDDLLNPKKNICIGAYYLKYLFERFSGCLNEVVFASYNAGEGNVSKWLKNPQLSEDGKSLKQIPFKETRDYVKKVEANIKLFTKILN